MKKFFVSLLIFFLSIILIFVLIVGYIFLRYRGWEKNFESNIKSEYLIDKDSIKDIDLSKEISDFAISLSDNEFLKLGVKEIGSVLFTVVDSYLGDEIELQNMYIEPSQSRWVIYAKIRYQKVALWISMDLNKDDIQSAQVYVKDINVGPFRIGEYTGWVDMINKGIGDSIVTLNENGLVGRYIENIELLDDSVVLKGSRY